MNIKAITNGTLSQRIKQQQQAMKLAQKMSEEAKLKSLTTSIAKDALGNLKQPTLNVGNLNSGNSTSSVINDYAGKLAITDSVWAPWSYIARNTKK